MLPKIRRCPESGPDLASSGKVLGSRLELVLATGLFHICGSVVLEGKAGTMSTPTAPLLIKTTAGGQTVLVLEALHNETLAPLVLAPGKYILGSGADCHYRIDNQAIGQHHCILLASEQKTVVESLDQRTWLNDWPFKESAFRHGDRLTLGPMTFRIRKANPAELLDLLVPTTAVQAETKSLQSESRTTRPSAATSPVAPAAKPVHSVTKANSVPGSSITPATRKSLPPAEVGGQTNRTVDSGLEGLTILKSAVRPAETSVARINQPVAPTQVEPDLETTLLNEVASVRSVLVSPEKGTVFARHEEALAKSLAELTAERQTLEEQRQAFVAERTAYASRLATERTQLSAAAAELDEALRSIENERESLEQRSREIADSSARVAKDQQSVAEQRQALLSAQKAIETEQEQLAARAQVLADDAEKLANRQALFLNEIAQFDELRAAALTEIERRENDLSSIAVDIEAGRRFIAEINSFEERRQRLERDEAALLIRESRLNERVEALDSATSALATREDQMLQRVESERFAIAEQCVARLADLEDYARRSADAVAESRLSAERDQVREELEQLRAELDAKTAELSGREVALAEYAAGLQVREEEVRKSGTKLDERKHEVDTLQEEVELQRKELASQEQLLGLKQAELEQARQTLAAEQELFVSQQGEFQKREAELNERLAEADARHEFIRLQEAQLGNERQQLTELSESSNAEIEQLSQKNEDLAARESAIAAKELALSQSADELEAHRNAVEQERATLEAERADFNAAQVKLADRDKDLTSLELAITTREQEVAALQASLADQEAALVLQRSELEAALAAVQKSDADKTIVASVEESDLNSLLTPALINADDLSQKQQELDELRALLSAERETLALRAAELEERQQRLADEEATVSNGRSSLEAERQAHEAAVQTLALDREQLAEEQAETRAKQSALDFEAEKLEAERNSLEQARANAAVQNEPSPELKPLEAGLPSEQSGQLPADRDGHRGVRAYYRLKRPWAFTSHATIHPPEPVATDEPFETTLETDKPAAENAVDEVRPVSDSLQAEVIEGTDADAGGDALIQPEGGDPTNRLRENLANFNKLRKQWETEEATETDDTAPVAEPVVSKLQHEEISVQSLSLEEVGTEDVNAAVLDSVEQPDSSRDELSSLSEVAEEESAPVSKTIGQEDESLSSQLIRMLESDRSFLEQAPEQSTEEPTAAAPNFAQDTAAIAKDPLAIRSELAKLFNIDESAKRPPRIEAEESEAAADVHGEQTDESGDSTVADELAADESLAEEIEPIQPAYERTESEAAQDLAGTGAILNLSELQLVDPSSIPSERAHNNGLAASAPAAASVAEPTAEPEEDSIAAYMERLLARTRQGPRTPAVEPAPRRVVVEEPVRETRPVEETISVEGSAIEAAPFPERVQPKVDRDTARSHLNSFREVANASARTAITTSRWKQQRLALITKWLLTGTTLVAGTFFLAGPLFGGERYDLQGSGLLIVGLFLLYESIRSTFALRATRVDRPKTPKKGIKQPEATAAESTDEASQG